MQVYVRRRLNIYEFRLRQFNLSLIIVDMCLMVEKVFDDKKTAYKILLVPLN